MANNKVRTLTEARKLITRFEEKIGSTPDLTMANNMIKGAIDEINEGDAEIIGYLKHMETVYADITRVLIVINNEREAFPWKGTGGKKLNNGLNVLIGQIFNSLKKAEDTNKKMIDNIKGAKVK